MSNLLAKLLTRSFPGKSPSLEEVRGDADVGLKDSSTQSEYESRALAMWLEAVSAQPGPRVFELGPLDPSTLDCLTGRGIGVSVLGLESNELDSLAGELDAFAVNDPFAGALLWDIPNYLDDAAMRALGAWLDDHLQPAGVVMACLATQVPYADRPGHYRVVDGNKLSYRPGATDGERNRRVTSADLTRVWAAFETHRSFLLRNGMQEFVLRRRGR